MKAFYVNSEKNSIVIKDNLNQFFLHTNLTANGTFCSPIALSKAEKCMIQSTRWSTTIFCNPLKSNISAKIYGPLLAISSLGWMISDSITLLLPKVFLKSLAHSVPSWPKPPEKCHKKNCSLFTLFYKIQLNSFLYMIISTYR